MALSSYSPIPRIGAKICLPQHDISHFPGVTADAGTRTHFACGKSQRVPTKVDCMLFISNNSRFIDPIPLLMVSSESKFALRAQRIPPKVCVLRPADERKGEGGEENHPDSEVRPHKQLSVVHSVLDRPRRHLSTFPLLPGARNGRRTFVSVCGLESGWENPLLGENWNCRGIVYKE